MVLVGSSVCADDVLGDTAVGRFFEVDFSFLSHHKAGFQKWKTGVGAITRVKEHHPFRSLCFGYHRLVSIVDKYTARRIADQSLKKNDNILLVEKYLPFFFTR